MRRTIATALAELADHDERIILLTGDLGYTSLEPFIEKHPDRYFNVGVAEQNMVGVATGLAEAGFIPFVYSIVTFATLRPYEFIRNGPIMHQFPVRILGVGGGVEYGHNGATHLGLEDVGVMRIQPGLTVITPADAPQARTALLKTWNLPGPIYYRLGKDDKLTVAGLNGQFELGRLQVIADGTDLAIITMGSIAPEARGCAELLARQGVSSAVAILSSLNPAPLDDLVKLLSRFRTVMTVEAHYVNGAAGSLVAEVIAEHGLACKLVRCGVRQSPDGVSGSQEFLLDKFGLTADRLAATALGLL